MQVASSDIRVQRQAVRELSRLQGENASLKEQVRLLSHELHNTTALLGTTPRLLAPQAAPDPRHALALNDIVFCGDAEVYPDCRGHALGDTDCDGMPRRA